MKKIIFFILVLAFIIAVGIVFFRSRTEPEQVFRANLTEAQKILVMLRRSEVAFGQSTQGYRYVSARKSGGKMIYSEGWRGMKLPVFETNTGFDYECLPAEGVCQATETGKTGASGNGIRINIKTGAYTCLGAYKPVTTEGFNGTLVTVACQA